MVDDYYNVSDPLEVDPTSNLPWGFKHGDINGERGFFVFLDINFSEQRSTDHLINAKHNAVSNPLILVVGAPII